MIQNEILREVAATSVPVSNIEPNLSVLVSADVLGRVKRRIPKTAIVYLETREIDLVVS